MISISNSQLADLFEARGRHPVGVYSAPAAIARWDGRTLVMEITGAPLEPETAARCPRLARALSFPALPPPPSAEPTIAALEADYSAATSPLAAAGLVLPAAAFGQRLAQCRACNLWNEPANEGRGLCESVNCHCSHSQLWLAGKSCPEGKWASNSP